MRIEPGRHRSEVHFEQLVAVGLECSLDQPGVEFPEAAPPVAGALGPRETVTEYGHGVYPDGLEFDAEGGFWVTSIVSNRPYVTPAPSSPRPVRVMAVSVALVPSESAASSTSSSWSNSSSFAGVAIGPACVAPTRWPNRPPRTGPARSRQAGNGDHPDGRLSDSAPLNSDSYR